MKLLTVSQPWAQLIVRGAKCIETRNYHPEYIGPVYILATKPTLVNLNKTSPIPFLDWFINADETLPFDMIVGKVDIVRVDPIEKIIMADKWLNAFESRAEKEIECAFGDYSIGNFAWTLENPEEFELPIFLENFNLLDHDSEEISMHIESRMAS